jgi:four helix bundle protein
MEPGVIVAAGLHMPEKPPRDLAERLFEFACDVVPYCRELSKEPGVVRHIAWQLSDSASSAAANYQEARAAYSRREFAAKNSIVLKELRESKLWLRIIIRCRLGPPAESQRLLNEVGQLCAIFTSSMKKPHPVAMWVAWAVVLTCNL